VIYQWPFNFVNICLYHLMYIRSTWHLWYWTSPYVWMRKLYWKLLWM